VNELKIKTVEDAVAASNNILANLVSNAAHKLTEFNLLVDEGEGNMTNIAWTPTSQLADGKNFLMVEDYIKTIILLLTHPRITDIEYNEKEHVITAVFWAPEIGKLQTENPYEEEP